MTKISVVIISKNADRTIKDVLQKAVQVSEDIVVIDSGSQDQTESICSQFNLRFHKQDWRGFGKQKNLGNTLAKNDWILSLDSDEVLSEDAINEINSLPLEEPFSFSFPFKNIYCGKLISYGRWKNEKHVRLFHKQEVQWNENAVHESLNYDKNKVILLNNPILHYSMFSRKEHLEKAEKYAKMGAERMYKQGKNSNWIKCYVNPVFRFIKDYFFSLGFLDGKLGFQIAWIISKETYWKYKHLAKLQQQKN